MPVFKSGVTIPPKKNPIRPKGTKKYAWLANWKVMDCIELIPKKTASASMVRYGSLDLVVCRVSCHVVRSTKMVRPFTVYGGLLESV